MVTDKHELNFQQTWNLFTESRSEVRQDEGLHQCVCPAVWLYGLLGVCGVISLLKSFISVLHLITASQNMAAMDAAERSGRAKKQ